MKTILFFCLLSFVPSDFECYNLLIANGLKAFNNRQFSTALQKFDAAKGCPEKPGDSDVDEWIRKAKLGLRDRQAWNRAVRADAQVSYENYLVDYPQGYYANEAGRAVERLKKAAQKPLEEISPSGKVDWTQQFVEASGQCAIDRKRFPDNEAQAILMATRGAELTAKARLLETLQGIHISRKSSIRDMIMEHDEIQAELEGTVKGARQTGDAVIAKDMVTVTVRMPMSQLNAFSSTDRNHTFEKPMPPVMPDSTAHELVFHFETPQSTPALEPLLVNEKGQIIMPLRATDGIRYIRAAELGDSADMIELREDDQGRWVVPDAAIPMLLAWQEVRQAKGEALPIRVLL